MCSCKYNGCTYSRYFFLSFDSIFRLPLLPLNFSFHIFCLSCIFLLHHIFRSTSRNTFLSSCPIFFFTSNIFSPSLYRKCCSFPLHLFLLLSLSRSVYTRTRVPGTCVASSHRFSVSFPVSPCLCRFFYHCFFDSLFSLSFPPQIHPPCRPLSSLRQFPSKVSRTFVGKVARISIARTERTFKAAPCRSRLIGKNWRTRKKRGKEGTIR